MTDSTQFNLARVHETVEAAVPDRPCVMWGDRTLSYAKIGDRSRQLANLLLGSGFGSVTERRALKPYESGQDHLAVYLHNSNEYLESMLGAFKARAVPFNVNYRYVSSELGYLLHDADARGIVFHSEFAPVLASIVDDLPRCELLLQVADDSGNDLLPGALWYDEAIAAQATILDEEISRGWSGDDLYLIYTGGTTGAPKGILWRQADIFAAAMGGRRPDTNQPWGSYAEIAANAVHGGARVLPASPFMHGAAHWLAFSAFTNGNTVVLSANTHRFDPSETLDTIESLDANVLLIVGDAFGRPLVEALEVEPRFADSLLVIVSGGAILSSTVKQRLVTALPNVMVLDGLGASETGTQASALTAPGQVASSGTFVPTAGAAVISSDRCKVLEPGHGGLGWLAQSGHIPLGYLGDPDRTLERIVDIDGVRYSLTGDRARLLTDGRVELKGREASVINSGGEKVFAEEVELAVLSHPGVRDCVVTGVPSQRWGEEVVGIIEVSATDVPDDKSILDTAGRSIARFKLPKELIRVDRIQRSPAGKPDYAWAKAVATERLGIRP